jgi:hypothetical protein
MPRLEVRQIADEDVYKDIVRVPEIHRIDNGKAIEEAKVCLIGGTPRSSFVVLRGYQDSTKAEIHMDERTRKRLGDIKVGQSYDFTFTRAGLPGELQWAWNASETGYRVASRLAVIGLILGLLAFIPVLVDWIKALWGCISR